MYVKHMTMHKLLLAFLLIHCVVINAYIEENIKTLHGYKDPPDAGQKTLVVDAESFEPSARNNRQKRAAENFTKKPPLADSGIITKVKVVV